MPCNYHVFLTQDGIRRTLKAVILRVEQGKELPQRVRSIGEGIGDDRLNDEVVKELYEIS